MVRSKQDQSVPSYGVPPRKVFEQMTFWVDEWVVCIDGEPGGLGLRHGFGLPTPRSFLLYTKRLCPFVTFAVAVHSDP